MSDDALREELARALAADGRMWMQNARPLANRVLPVVRQVETDAQIRALRAAARNARGSMVSAAYLHALADELQARR